MVPLLLVWNTFALFIARVIFALVFIVHGWPKIKDLKQNTANFGMMGFRPGWFWGTIVALVEFIGGSLVLIGFLTQVFALFLAVNMAVSVIWKLSRKQKFVAGYEFDLALLAIGLVLATSGGGAYSIDNYLQFLAY